MIKGKVDYDSNIITYLNKYRKIIIRKVRYYLRKSNLNIDDNDIINECYISCRNILSKFNKDKSSISTYLNRYLVNDVVRNMYPRYNLSLIRTPICWGAKSYRPKDIPEFLTSSVPMCTQTTSGEEYNIIDTFINYKFSDSISELSLLLDKIEQLINTGELSRNQGEVLLLNAIGYTHKELSKIYKCSRQLITKWIKIARSKVKEEL